MEDFDKMELNLSYNSIEMLDFKMIMDFNHNWYSDKN